MSRFKYTQTAAVATCLALVLGTVGVGHAQDAPTDEQFNQAKSQFEEVWKTAADNSKRQAELQTTIAKAQDSVDKAKSDLATLSDARRDLRLQIAEQRELIDTLAAQRLQVAHDKERYLALAQSERERISTYVRFEAVRDMVAAETGPVNGGAIVRKMLRGSLDDSVDTGLSVAAVSKAREELVGRLLRMADATDAVETRLHAVAQDLDAGMAALETKNQKLGESIDERNTAIDDGWRTMTLSQEQLKTVQDETAEVSAKVIEMQQSLVRINAQLKQSKLEALQKAMDDAEAKYKDVLAQRQSLQDQDVKLQGVEDAALKAWKTAQDNRNSDKKQYKRVEDVQRDLDIKQNRKNEIDAVLGGTASEPAFNDTTVEKPDPEAMKLELPALEASITTLTEKIGYMKQGITEDDADAYMKAKDAAAAAKEQRAGIAKQLADASPLVAAAVAKTSELSAQIDQVNRESGLDGLPPIFQWPVHGTITAGYYDPDYQTVFGVPHKAIDIAVTHGTPVHPIAEGVVFAVKLGGAKGYTYVLIGHRNGYASLYGHLSQVYVKSGDLVDYTTVIGLSGGTPGTEGAGPMTTGAHLHLEVMKDGEHLNPQTVLP